MGLGQLGQGIVLEFDALLQELQRVSASYKGPEGDPVGLDEGGSPKRGNGLDFLKRHCTEKLIVAGHSLGGALASIFASLVNKVDHP